MARKLRETDLTNVSSLKLQNCTALTVQTGFKNSPWECHLQRSAQPQAAGKSSLFRAGFPRLPLSLVPFTINNSEVAAGPFRPRRRAGEAPGARGVRARPALHAPERTTASPTWVGNPRAGAAADAGAGVGAGGAASALAARPAAPATAALGRSRRRQESAAVTPASRRPRRRRRRRRRPRRSTQRAPATPSTESGRLLGPLCSGIRS